MKHVHTSTDVLSRMTYIQLFDCIPLNVWYYLIILVIVVVAGVVTMDDKR